VQSKFAQRASSRPLVQVLFPSALTARQRAALHDVAGSAGVAHISTGDGAQRRIWLGNSAAATVRPANTQPAAAPPWSTCASSVLYSSCQPGRPDFEEAATRVQAVEVPEGALSDDALCALLRQHLCLDAAAALSAPAPAAQASQTTGPAGYPPADGGGQGGGRGRGAEGAAARARPAVGRGTGPARPLTLDEFVARTLPLIELEREAEVAQVRSPAEVMRCGTKTSARQGWRPYHERQACRRAENVSVHAPRDAQGGPACSRLPVCLAPSQACSRRPLIRMQGRG